ncbi:hypothetical protein AACH06_28310 [Ideonella sp. DXS29W]|uniref:Uncharacterized protein n=1 Tax=Ideonella lacteola TaxID=2984193 RepID=A0ABU9C0X4_9BURK
MERYRAVILAPRGWHFYFYKREAMGTRPGLMKPVVFFSVCQRLRLALP